MIKLSPISTSFEASDADAYDFITDLLAREPEDALEYAVREHKFEVIFYSYESMLRVNAEIGSHNLFEMLAD